MLNAFDHQRDLAAGVNMETRFIPPTDVSASISPREAIDILFD